MEQESGNAAIYFVDRHREAAYCEKNAFIEGHENGRTLTYAELADQSDCIPALYQKHQLKREDRVAVLVLDTIEFPVIFWGSLKAGVIPILLNTLLSSDLYSTILKDSRVRALFVSIELLPVILPAIKENQELQAVFVVSRGTSCEYLDYASELNMSSTSSPLVCSGDEVAFWLYTSGSTGLPKGVKHVHSSLKATADTYGSQVLGIKHDDVVFSVAKLFFAYGLGNGMTFPMSVGATTVLFSGRPTPESVVDVMQRIQPTVFYAVPTLYASMLASIEGETIPGFENVRRCISAGEALPAEIGRCWSDVVACEILEGVGSTELLQMFLSNFPDDVVYGTSGVAVPGYELKIVDDNGNSVNQDEIGELIVKGPSAAEGYWNQRDKSRATFEGVWTRTGDKFKKRSDARYVYCGRTNDMFKVSGIWVSPFEVEQELISHPSVLEAAVVPILDENNLEKPKAFVVLKSGIVDDNIAKTLKQHVKERIGKWKYPRWVEVLEALPKTATGKIQRFKLREVDNP